MVHLNPDFGAQWRHTIQQSKETGPNGVDGEACAVEDTTNKNIIKKAALRFCCSCLWNDENISPPLQGLTCLTYMFFLTSLYQCKLISIFILLTHFKSADRDSHQVHYARYCRGRRGLGRAALRQVFLFVKFIVQFDIGDTGKQTLGRMIPN